MRNCNEIDDGTVRQVFGGFSCIVCLFQYFPMLKTNENDCCLLCFCTFWLCQGQGRFLWSLAAEEYQFYDRIVPSTLIVKGASASTGDGHLTGFSSKIVNH